MRKLKLDLDELHVESFSATSLSTPGGTVNGLRFDPLYPDIPYESVEACEGTGGGGANTVGTCVGPTYCCPVSWKPSCDSCAETYCNNSRCMGSCDASCPGIPCTAAYTNCSL